MKHSVDLKTTIMKRISLKHVPERLPKMNKTFIWRKSYKDLPQKLVTKIDRFLETNKVIELSCWFNSHNLAFEVDGISVVNGWYGEKVKKSDELFSELEELRKLNPNKRFVKPKKGVIIDLKWNLFYSKHSWNKYGDHHFCLTTEIDNVKNNRFFVFKEFEEFSGTSIKSNENVYSEYRNVINEALDLSSLHGYKVLNTRQLRNSNKRKSGRFSQILTDRNLV